MNMNMEKGWYYDEYYDDDLYLVTTDENVCSESEPESNNDSVPHEMFFEKEKNILASLEKLSTFVNSFTVCKFCNNPIPIEKDNDKAAGSAYFLKIVCQNRKCLKSKINSSVQSKCQTKMVEQNIVKQKIGYRHSAANKLISVLNVTHLFLKKLGRGTQKL